MSEVHPSRPGSTQGISFRDGRFETFGVSLKNVIAMAYDVDDNMVTGGEKWLESDHFDVIAKAPPTASFAAVQVMLKTLLVKSFKLAIHKEDQTVPAYALTLGTRSPKIAESDGSARSGCKLGIADGVRNYACQNTTMA